MRTPTQTVDGITFGCYQYAIVENAISKTLHTHKHHVPVPGQFVGSSNTPERSRKFSFFECAKKTKRNR